MRFMTAVAVGALIAASHAYARTEATLDLVGPISEYKIFVSEQIDLLVADTTEFVAAIKAGDVEKAKALFAPARINYEEVEPIAELFSDLDVAIDSRADDYELAEADPDFPGFHRLEYGLWEKSSTEGLDPIADKLLADVTELQSRVEGLEVSETTGCFEGFEKRPTG